MFINATDYSQVITTDVPVTNGVVHVINRVLKVEVTSDSSSTTVESTTENSSTSDSSSTTVESTTENSSTSMQVQTSIIFVCLSFALSIFKM